MTPDEEATIRKLMAAMSGVLGWLRQLPVSELEQPRAETLRVRLAMFDEAMAEARARWPEPS